MKSESWHIDFLIQTEAGEDRKASKVHFVLEDNNYHGFVFTCS